MIELKNISGEVLELHIYEFEVDESLDITNDRDNWKDNDDTLFAITNSQIQVVVDSLEVESVSDQIDALKGNKVAISNIENGEITSTGIKNDHCIEPWGAAAGKFKPSDYSCAIDLSNKSQDGLTFTYSCSKTPKVGAYVFQNDATVRSWITAVNTGSSTVTFDLPVLENGINNCYREGVIIDCKIRDYKPYMYLWGLYLKVLNAHDDDFVELDVVDADDLFMTDDYCLEQFGVDSATANAAVIPYLGFEKLGEFSEWCKYYDESWVINMNNREVKTPDGAPGKLLTNLSLRMVYYPRYQEPSVTVSVYLDYLATSKDSDWQ